MQRSTKGVKLITVSRTATSKQFAELEQRKKLLNARKREALKKKILEHNPRD